ncbi:MAG: hypothetical protein AABX99_03370 [Nanoarchaeota archaeon]
MKNMIVKSDLDGTYKIDTLEECKPEEERARKEYEWAVRELFSSNGMNFDAYMAEMEEIVRSPTFIRNMKKYNGGRT